MEMERVQGRLPEQATATHLLSCFTPPPDLSPQYPAPPHHSSQALLWNNSSNAHQDLLHRNPHWLPQCTPSHIPSRPALWNSLGAANNASDAPVSHPLDSTVAPLDDAGLSTLLFNDHAHTTKNRSFPQPVVSVPFSCKLDMATAKSRNTLLASLSSHIAEDMDRYPGAEDNGHVSVKTVDRPIRLQGNVKSHQSSKGLKCGGEEPGDESGEAQLKKQLQKQKEEVRGAPIYGTGDAGIGLKLGKRIYFGDSGGVGVEASKHSTLASTANACHSNGKNNTCNSNGASAKKLKTSSPAVNVPRCQAEDCKIDLSGAKDYHRRHKVCEWHSKSSKVKVANVDQRFCQQCSRFHVLSEFDEGKRSCRRRLAGHNERRRKQQPEPFSLLSAASYAYFTGAKHLFSTSVSDCPYFFDHEHVGADLEDLKMRKPKDEPVGNYPALELHHFMQGSQRGDEHLLGGGAQAFVLAGGNAINPPAPLMTLASCLVPDHPQPSPETLVSGRALSLLSSSLGFPNTSDSVSKALGVSSPSFEGYLLENHHATPSHQIMSRASSHFTSSASKPIEILPLSHNCDINTLPGPESAAVTHCLSMNQIQPSTILSFGGSYAFPILPESEVHSDAERPVLDLMQVSLAGPCPPRHRVEHQFTDLEGLSIFGRQSLM